MADQLGWCIVFPRPPRGIPIGLWRATVSEFYFEDALGIRRLAWSKPTKLELRAAEGEVHLHYTAPNEIWLRRVALDPAELKGRTIHYRARLLPFLKPRVDL